MTKEIAVQITGVNSFFYNEKQKPCYVVFHLHEDGTFNVLGCYAEEDMAMAAGVMYMQDAFNKGATEPPAIHMVLSNIFDRSDEEAVGIYAKDILEATNSVIISEEGLSMPWRKQEQSEASTSSNSPDLKCDAEEDQ